MIGSIYKRDLSVITPSIGISSILHSKKSSIGETFHISNPNPQSGKKKYLGVRD